MVLAKYFNDRADTWDENAAEQDTGKLKRMAKRLELRPGSKVLDVGTGTGIFLPYLLDRIGESGSVVAVDIAEGMLKKAQEKNCKGNIRYLLADIMDAPLEDGQFDYAVCYSCFPHFEDKAKALAEINRVLKNGGRIFVCHTSSREHINGIHSELPDVQDHLLPDVIDMYMMLSSAGFTGLHVEEDDESYFASGVK